MAKILPMIVFYTNIVGTLVRFCISASWPSGSKDRCHHFLPNKLSGWQKNILEKTLGGDTQEDIKKGTHTSQPQELIGLCVNSLKLVVYTQTERRSLHMLELRAGLDDNKTGWRDCSPKSLHHGFMQASSNK